MNQQMKAILAAVVLATITSSAHATVINDNYWGAGLSGTTNNGTVLSDAGLSGDIYAAHPAQYDITNMNVTNSGKVLTVTINAPTYFSSWIAGTTEMWPGSLFISTNGWHPSGSGPYNQDKMDSSHPGTSWNYAITVDNLLSPDLIKMVSGSTALYQIDKNFIGYGILRDVQEAWYDDAAGTSKRNGTGTWLLTDTTLSIIMDLTSTGWNGIDPLGLHWTMACANDVIEGQYTPVPEPASMLLFGTGLLGLAGIARRRTTM